MFDPLPKTKTLNEFLRKRVELSGGSTWLTLYSKDKIACKLTYAELLEGAICWSAELLKTGVRPGDRILLILPTEKAFYEAFWGILQAGAIPVPLYPPMRLARIEEYLKSLGNIIHNCGASVLVTNGLIRPLIRPVERINGHRISFLISRNNYSKPVKPDRSARPDDMGLLQYTSGSTGSQKGVMLTHANLLANLRAIGRMLRPSSEDVAVSWLPLYHDMGLIGLMMGTLYWGIPLVAMSPIDFLRKPARWIRIMSNHHATFTAGPNFAYNLTAHKIRDVDLEGVDLSNWRIALCGAEPIHASTIENFSNRYEPMGFCPQAFLPAYGLAENTLAVSFPDLETPPTIENFDNRMLETEGKAVCTDSIEKGRKIVSMGCPLESVEVAIMGEKFVPLEEGGQGEIVIRGPSVMAGYFNNPVVTANVFRDGWLCTGDMGFMRGGQLYISGRKKDMVIKAGRNYFAEELEAAAYSVSGVRPGGVCVFSINDPERGTECVILVAEIIKGLSTKDLSNQLIKVVAKETNCKPNKVVLVPPRTLPKTSSGKIQRFQTRLWYLDGSIQSRGRERKIMNYWGYAKAFMRDRFSMNNEME
ncbi:fatty acyl-AMP ligase [Desulfobacula sp.]|uniref:fatty acyl-AMP ligase n=1 Tax=Desulfobacula sp. TaxID=2593537 RepID=UPI00262B1615|nr:fatty acyl-AMP ligase [Desulfobacula sp.]